MKIKTLYIYGIIILVIVAILVFIDTGNSSEKTDVPADAQTTVPQDEIHQGLGNKGAGPSKSDVKPEFWENLDKMGKEVEANPKDTLKILEYAQLLSLAHQTDKALEQYEKILKIDPNRTDILLAEGLLYFNLGKYSEAEKVTNRVLKIDKNHLEAKFNLGVIAVSQGDKEKARKIWSDLIKNNPGTEAATYAEEALARL